MSAIKMLSLWLGSTALISIVASWQSIVIWADKNPNMASWVQAIGSIAAILATGAGVYWAQALQEKRHIELDRLQRKQVLSTAHELVRGAAATLYDYSDGPTRPLVPIDLMTLQAQYEGLSHALRKLDIAALGDFAVIEAVITTDAILRKMALLVDSILKKPNASMMLEWAGVQGEALRGYIEVTRRSSRIEKLLNAHE